MRSATERWEVSRTNGRWMLVGAVALVLAGLVVKAADVPGGLTKEQTVLSAPTGRTVAVGRVAPDFALPQLDSPKALSLDQVLAAHKVTVVNFWATWCHYCKAEMPMLARVARAAGGQVVILGIDDTATESSVGAVAAYVRRTGVHYPILLDETGETFSQYAVHAYPTTYFVNAAGVVTGVVVGELSPSLLRYELAQAGASAQTLAAIGTATAATPSGGA